MQNPEPAAAPKAPTPPLPPTAVTTVGSDGKTITLAVPQTASEIAALRARREELSNQLNSVTERRGELVNQVRSAPEGTARTGLEDRIHLLDNRLLLLESDIAAIGRQIAAAPASLLGYEEESPQTIDNGDNFEDGLAVGGGMMLLFFAVVTAVRRYRRKGRPPAADTRAIPADSARLERLEHGVEAIAIEVERISEGQRFVTRLLSEANLHAEPAQTIKD